MTDQRVVPFNVNQFDKRRGVIQDLEARIDGADVLLLQELVNFDLHRFARGHAGWTAHQLDAGENNGHANTAILFRSELGPVEDKVCLYVGKAKDTRARYMIGVKLQGVWYVSLHIFPRRDTRLIAGQLKVAGAWAREHEGEPMVFGLDKNQAKPVALESATALTWHGGKEDPTGGILTNLKVSKAAEFKKGHSDHLGYAATVTIPDPKPAPRTAIFAAPAPEYVGPSPNVMHNPDGTPWDNQPITRIVMHCTVSPCVDGGRYAIAHLFKQPGRQASAHYVTDPGGAVQVVWDDLVAEHAPPNPHSLGIEMCDPLASVAWDKVHAGRWHDAPHQAMLHHAARLVARLCLAYNVPVVKLTADQVKAEQRGICGHVDVSDAFGESTHWDPGPEFPWDDFIGMVQRRVTRLKGAA